MSRAPSFRARFEARVADLGAQVHEAPVLLARGGEHA
jgi:hypothetical protein